MEKINCDFFITFHKSVKKKTKILEVLLKALLVKALLVIMHSEKKLFGINLLTGGISLIVFFSAVFFPVSEQTLFSSTRKKIHCNLM